MTLPQHILQAADERIRRLVGGLRPTKDDRRAVHLLARVVQEAPKKDLQLPPPHEDGHAARTAEVRAAVWTRSNGRCENPECGYFIGHGQDVGVGDHFFGGSGRRKPETTVEGMWRLCVKCNAAKTEERPDHRTWLRRFATHCVMHGFRAQAVKVDRALALYEGKHPTRNCEDQAR